jgi:two-component sensor histidine kinase
MIAAGHFPFPDQRSSTADSPRVGDGFVRIDAHGRVSYASPNALSVYRRLGLATDLAGLDLAETTRGLVPAARRPDEETISAVLGGRLPRDAEIGPDDHGTVLIIRAIPLRPAGEHIGALVLLRDVTDLRRRDRELVTKDATIREIHHRVKNNLQTVAALLRLQARRIDAPSGRQALEEAVRRVGSIAIVHETLSQAFDESVDFDDVADRLRVMVTDVHSGGPPVASVREGSFGTLPAAVATPLAMVLTELLQNAVQHGYADGRETGRIVLAARRIVGRLHVTVDDDGSGLPPGFDLDGSVNLGLSIVRTLVESELAGQLELGERPGGGTRVALDLPVEGHGREAGSGS